MANEPTDEDRANADEVMRAFWARWREPGSIAAGTTLSGYIAAALAAERERTVEEVATLKAEVAALREALLDMRSIVIGYWSMDMTPAEIEADKTMTKARAALSPKEA